MSIFATSLSDYGQVKPLLDALWARLQQINDAADSVDRSMLDQEDDKELSSICGITAGYTYFIIEAGSSLESDEPFPLEVIGEFALLIQSHCDDCETAFSHVLRLQSSRDRRQTVRVH